MYRTIEYDPFNSKLSRKILVFENIFFLLHSLKSLQDNRIYFLFFFIIIVFLNSYLFLQQHAFFISHYWAEYYF